MNWPQWESGYYPGLDYSQNEVNYGGEQTYWDQMNGDQQWEWQGIEPGTDAVGK